MTRIIEITISPDGQATVQTKGFAGASCRDVSRFLEAALGRIDRERLTPEFHQAVSQQAGQQQRLQ
jgi:hypothetical protein